MPAVPETQRIRDALENAVIDGHYRPGDQLDPARLATEYGCSRTPIREALQALERSGLVQIKPKRGTFVTQLDITDLAERFEVMAELEGLAAGLAAQRRTASALADMAVAIDECASYARADDADGYYYANARFHGIVYSECGNGHLTTQITDLKRVLQPYRRLQLRVPHRMHRSLAEHQGIADAISAGDRDVACTLAKGHVLVQVQEFSHLVHTWRAVASGGASG